MSCLKIPEKVNKDSLYCVTLFWNRTGIIFHGIPSVGGKACVKMEQCCNVDVYNFDQNTIQLFLIRVINAGYLDFSSEMHAYQGRQVLTI